MPIFLGRIIQVRSSELESTDEIDASQKLLKDASNELADFQIGFVIFDLKVSPEDALLAGSGTLVEIEGQHGILTADHVIENRPQRGDIGLILPTRLPERLHAPTLNIEFSNKINIARGKIDSEGPDLAFLTLPQQIIGALKAR